jgi:hypothetical protein
VALLATVTLYLGHRHAVDADGRQCLAHLVKLEWFDDRDDEFHGQAFVFRWVECSLAVSAAWSAGRCAQRFG